MKFFENIAVCHKTDIGLKRKKNEDSYLIVDHREKSYDTRDQGVIFAVADGMGGHAAGEVASKMACKGLLEYFALNSDSPKDLPSAQTVLVRLETAIWQTHKQIMTHAEKNELFAGMGTTLSVLCLVGREAVIAHVGDSRIYRLRYNCLEQLTEDDTMAQLSVEMGHLNQKEAETHPLRHALIQAVGQDIDKVHTRIEKVKTGDIFLLCSDGLHNMIADDEMREILINNPIGFCACDKLIDSALKSGGEDNVTVIVVRI